MRLLCYESGGERRGGKSKLLDPILTQGKKGHKTNLEVMVGTRLKGARSKRGPEQGEKNQMDGEDTAHT